MNKIVVARLLAVLISVSVHLPRGAAADEIPADAERVWFKEQK